jgi:hypothetical protein
MIQYRNTEQSTARIVLNAAVCRTFVRAVLSIVSRPPWDGYRPLSEVPPANRICGKVVFSASFIPCNDDVVGAVGTLTTFTGT